MLGLAKFKRARFLLASTSEVYGDPEVHPQPESYWGNVNPIGPRGVYDEAKRYAEALTMAYHRQQGVDTCIARIFNTYGPRMRPHDGRAIPTFLRQALQDKPLTVFGDGLADAQLLLRRGPDPRPGRRCRGRTTTSRSTSATRSEMTLLELAETVIEVTGSRSEIIFEALPQDDPRVRQPDITTAMQVLGLDAGGRAARRAQAHDRRRPASSASSAPARKPVFARREAGAPDGLVTRRFRHLDQLVERAAGGAGDPARHRGRLRSEAWAATEASAGSPRSYPRRRRHADLPAKRLDPLDRGHRAPFSCWL